MVCSMLILKWYLKPLIFVYKTHLLNKRCRKTVAHIDGSCRSCMAQLRVGNIDGNGYWSVETGKPKQGL